MPYLMSCRVPDADTDSGEQFFERHAAGIVNRRIEAWISVLGTKHVERIIDHAIPVAVVSKLLT